MDQVLEGLAIHNDVPFPPLVICLYGRLVLYTSLELNAPSDLVLLQCVLCFVQMKPCFSNLLLWLLHVCDRFTYSLPLVRDVDCPLCR